MVSNFLLISSQGTNNTHLNFAQFPHRIVIFQVDVFVYTVRDAREEYKDNSTACQGDEPDDLALIAPPLTHLL